jgi:hypothetical protein
MADIDQATPPENTQDLSFEENNTPVENVSFDTDTQTQPLEEEQNVSKMEEPQQEKKISRAEKRIKQILEKKDTPVADDYIELEEDVFKQTIQREVQKAIELDRAKQAYVQKAQEHQQDIEQIQRTGLPKAIEDLATKQYYSVNFQHDPFTGKDVFVPVVKFSEIVKDIQDKLTLAAAEFAKSGQEYRRQVENLSAISPTAKESSSSIVSEDTTDFKAFEKAYSKR